MSVRGAIITFGLSCLAAFIIAGCIRRDNRVLQLGDLKELIDGERNLVFIGDSPASLFITQRGCFSCCGGDKGKYGEYMPFLRRCVRENSGMSILLRVDEKSSVGMLADAMSDCKTAGISKTIICAITNSECEEFNDNQIDLPMMRNCYKIDVSALQSASLDIEIRRGRNVVIDGEFVSLSEVASCVSRRAGKNKDLCVFIRADREVPFSKLHDVVETVIEMGVWNVFLVGDSNDECVGNVISFLPITWM
ncbi:MAG: hypothetical protein K6G94_05655 [Kiritimatiellae bacterium]|nr:hypothetical protein [Kiritimatiellia bacterium]